jgi:predicted alpha/beta hydrolase family esterase
MRDIAEFDILVLAGLYNSGLDHWQSHWEAAFPNMRRVQQDDWDRPVYADWARRLSEEVDRSTKPVLLIAHSLGTSLVMRWAHAAKIQAVAGAFLVAPSDRDFENDPDFPARVVQDIRMTESFGPMLLQSLPLPSMVLASRNDECVSFERAQVFAAAWGSHLIDVGPLGHIGSAAKLGLWPHGLVWLGQFIGSLPLHSHATNG